jgi:hypothetical protein
MPPDLVVKNAVNRRSAFSVEIPTPQSFTVTSTCCSSSCRDPTTGSRGRSSATLAVPALCESARTRRITSAARLPSSMIRPPTQVRFIQIGSSAFEPPQAGLAVGDDGGERLLYFVCERRGQLSQHRHARDVGEFHLRRPERACA